MVAFALSTLMTSVTRLTKFPSSSRHFSSCCQISGRCCSSSAQLDAAHADSGACVISSDQLLAEIQLLRLKGQKVPKFVDDFHLKQMRMLEVPEDRVKYLTFLYRRELKREIGEAAKLKKRQLETPSATSNDVLNNGIFLRRNKTSLRQSFWNVRLADAWLSRRYVVLDGAYVTAMSYSERRMAQIELRHLFGHNARARVPCHFVMTDIDTKDTFWHEFCEEMKMEAEPDELLQGRVDFTLTEKPLRDVMDQQGLGADLVYLTPEADEEIDYLDGNKSYVVGLLVDSTVRKLSFDRATGLGICTAKFPLSRFPNLPQYRLSIADSVKILINSFKHDNSLLKAIPEVVKPINKNMKIGHKRRIEAMARLINR